MMRSRIVILMLLLLALGMALLCLRRDIAHKAYLLNSLNRRSRQLQKECYRCELQIARLKSTDRLLTSNVDLRLGLVPSGGVPAPDVRMAQARSQPSLNAD